MLFERKKISLALASVAILLAVAGCGNVDKKNDQPAQSVVGSVHFNAGIGHLAAAELSGNAKASFDNFALSMNEIPAEEANKLKEEFALSLKPEDWREFFGDVEHSSKLLADVVDLKKNSIIFENVDLPVDKMKMEVCDFDRQFDNLDELNSIIQNHQLKQMVQMQAVVDEDGNLAVLVNPLSIVDLHQNLLWKWQMKNLLKSEHDVKVLEREKLPENAVMKNWKAVRVEDGWDVSYDVMDQDGNQELAHASYPLDLDDMMHKTDEEMLDEVKRLGESTMLEVVVELPGKLVLVDGDNAGLKIDGNVLAVKPLDLEENKPVVVQVEGYYGNHEKINLDKLQQAPPLEQEDQQPHDERGAVYFVGGMTEELAKMHVKPNVDGSANWPAVFGNVPHEMDESGVFMVSEEKFNFSSISSMKSKMQISDIRSLAHLSVVNGNGWVKMKVVMKAWKDLEPLANRLGAQTYELDDAKMREMLKNEASKNGVDVDIIEYSTELNGDLLVVNYSFSELSDAGPSNIKQARAYVRGDEKINNIMSHMSDADAEAAVQNVLDNMILQYKIELPWDNISIKGGPAVTKSNNMVVFDVAKLKMGETYEIECKDDGVHVPL